MIYVANLPHFLESSERGSHGLSIVYELFSVAEWSKANVVVSFRIEFGDRCLKWLRRLVVLLRPLSNLIAESGVTACDAIFRSYKVAHGDRSWPCKGSEANGSMICTCNGTRSGMDDLQLPIKFLRLCIIASAQHSSYAYTTLRLIPPTRVGGINEMLFGFFSRHRDIPVA